MDRQVIIGKAAETAVSYRQENENKMQKKFEEKTSENTDQKTANAEQLINEKFAASKDGMIYLDDADMREILDALKEDRADKDSAEQQPQVGENIDLQV